LDTSFLELATKDPSGTGSSDNAVNVANVNVNSLTTTTLGTSGTANTGGSNGSSGRNKSLPRSTSTGGAQPKKRVSQSGIGSIPPSSSSGNANLYQTNSYPGKQNTKDSESTSGPPGPSATRPPSSGASYSGSLGGGRGASEGGASNNDDNSTKSGIPDNVSNNNDNSTTRGNQSLQRDGSFFGNNYDQSRGSSSENSNPNLLSSSGTYDLPSGASNISQQQSQQAQHQQRQQFVTQLSNRIAASTNTAIGSLSTALPKTISSLKDASIFNSIESIPYNIVAESMRNHFSSTCNYASIYIR
jgi:hypothetical protein